MQQVLAAYLVNAAWQAPVVAFCALLVARFGGLSPGARNRLWLMALAVATVLPAVPREALMPQVLPSVARVPLDAPEALPASAPAIGAAATSGGLDPAIQLAPWAAWAMAALCALAAGLLIARLVVASAAARRLVRESKPAFLPADVAQALDRLARAHGRRTPPIRRSPSLGSPAVVGALSPVILIPEDMAAQGDDLRAAMLHELAHVLRHDYAVNVACEVLTLPVCWHPALHGIKAGVRRSRELACDAIAAKAMASQKTYARCLVSLAQALGAPSAPANTALAVGLFGRSDLEERLMQLMNPKDPEAPVLRAARLCGLAAVGASLLGSAALLHVTPVFAQTAPAAPSAHGALPAIPALPAIAAVGALPAVPAVPAVPAAPAVPAPPAIPAAPEAPAHPRHGMIISKHGVIVQSGGHSHSWTGADGQTFTVVNDDAREPSAAQQREWEAAARDAEAQAAKVEAMVKSPEFKAKIAKAKADAAAARAMVESPEFKAKIAKAKADGEAARAMVESPEFKAQIAKAKADGEAARAMVNSPEFKAQIAKARADAAAVRAMVNSPEFRAKIAKAKADGEAARAMVNSPEFRAQIERLRGLGDQIQREFDEPAVRERTAPGPTP